MREASQVHSLGSLSLLVALRVLDAGINGGGFRQVLTGHARDARLAVAAAIALAVYRLESDNVLVKLGRDDEIGAPA